MGAPRMRFGRVNAAVLLCVVLGASSWTAMAAGSREQAVAQALQQAGGDARVLGVTERRDSDGRVIYEVKVISGGRVQVVNVPAD